MKAQTAKDFAKHLQKAARGYKGAIYMATNNYNPFSDADEIAKELKKIARDMGEKESDY